MPNQTPDDRTHPDAASSIDSGRRNSANPFSHTSQRRLHESGARVEGLSADRVPLVCGRSGACRRAAADSWAVAVVDVASPPPTTQDAGQRDPLGVRRLRRAGAHGELVREPLADDRGERSVPRVVSNGFERARDVRSWLGRAFPVACCVSVLRGERAGLVAVVLPAVTRAGRGEW